MTTSVIIPRSDHERATRVAYALRWTLGETIRVALHDWLADHDVSRKRTSIPNLDSALVNDDWLHRRSSAKGVRR